MEDPRLEIALYKTPVPYQFVIIPYYEKQYLLDHVIHNQVDDSPAELLQAGLIELSKATLSQNNQKIQQVQSIITHLLIHSSIDLLDTFEDLDIHWEIKWKVMKDIKEIGGNLIYYRWAIRSLINNHDFAREQLKLDHDEELEALHHLDEAKHIDYQIAFELAVWKSIEANYSDSDYLFNELIKVVPKDYQPQGKIEKVTTLTYDKLKAYLGQFDIEMEEDVDESYVRELFHFCRELDGTKRIHRQPQSQNTAINEIQFNQNIQIIDSLVNESDLEILYIRAKKLLKPSIYWNSAFSNQARTIFENILSQIKQNSAHLWPDTVYSCSLLTIQEKDVGEQFFNTLIDIINIGGYPCQKHWAYFLAMTSNVKGQNNLIMRLKQNRQNQMPDELIKQLALFELIQHVTMFRQVYTNEFFNDCFISMLQMLQSQNSKLVGQLIEAFDNMEILGQLARWLFTALRILKYVKRLKISEADEIFQYEHLINFQEKFMIDIPTDITYKIISSIKEARKMNNLTLLVLQKCKKIQPSPFYEYFLGNLALIQQDFDYCIMYYLRCSKVQQDEIFYQRLCYCLIKKKAYFEAVILGQLQDSKFDVVRYQPIIQLMTIQNYLIPFLVNIQLIESLIQKVSSKAKKLLFERLYSDELNIYCQNKHCLIQQITEQFLDLLSFTYQVQSFKKSYS